MEQMPPPSNSKETNETLSSLSYTINTGQLITNAVPAMLAIAKASNHSVVTEFNGKLVLVFPDSDPNSVIDEAIGRKPKDYYSPENIKKREEIIRNNYKKLFADLEVLSFDNGYGPLMGWIEQAVDVFNDNVVVLKERGDTVEDTVNSYKVIQPEGGEISKVLAIFRQHGFKPEDQARVSAQAMGDSSSDSLFIVLTALAYLAENGTIDSALKNDISSWRKSS